MALKRLTVSATTTYSIVVYDTVDTQDDLLQAATEMILTIQYMNLIPKYEKSWNMVKHWVKFPSSVVLDDVEDLEED